MRSNPALRKAGYRYTPLTSFKMTNSEKLKALKKLGERRRLNCYDGFHNLSEFHSGKYESEFVSPYTKGSQNVNSEVFVMLQDWTSKEKIEQGLGEEPVTLGYSPKLPTNKNLKTLLNNTFNYNISDVFTTNLFPYIKSGSMDASIPQRFMRKAFSDFALPQIEIVQPQLVVCCGASVFRTAAKHFNQETRQPLFLNQHFAHEGVIYIYQNHPGSRGTNSAGGIEKVKRNWEFMRSLVVRSGV